MQLTIEVLPAPLGPIIENSSPSFTPKLTSASARTPPKRSDTPRTSKACSTHSLHWRLFRFSRNIRSLSKGVLHALFLWRLPVRPARPRPAGPVTIFNYGGQVPSLGPWQKLFLHILRRPAAPAVKLPAIPCARPRCPCARQCCPRTR